MVGFTHLLRYAAVHNSDPGESRQGKMLQRTNAKMRDDRKPWPGRAVARVVRAASFMLQRSQRCLT
jgi:hypothetical protein